jgi:hypothetical protein
VVVAQRAPLSVEHGLVFGLGKVESPLLQKQIGAAAPGA